MITDKKTIIGVTGSFGTGKTFVASVFKSLGGRVIDADGIARSVLKKNRGKVIAAFGIAGRKALAKIVFGNRKRLAKLNRMIHPEVIRIIKKKTRMTPGVIVIDAPLLVEANLTGLVDYVVVVKASREKQIKRCMKKFGITKDEVLRRIKSQASLKKKEGFADSVVDNDGARSETRKQVKEIWERISRNIT